MSQSLEGGFSTWGQGRGLAQQLVHHADFSILLLHIFIWSPRHVMLQLVGTKEVMGTACSPFLEAKEQVLIRVRSEKAPFLLRPDFFLCFSPQTTQTIAGKYNARPKYGI